MVMAVLSSEDPFFFWHLGFNPLEIWRALLRNRSGTLPPGRRAGGSTITQQVAKNVFLWPGQSYARKALETVLTLLIEALWSKPRILEVYLNVVNFGDDCFGVASAAKRFFGCSAAELSAEQAGLLTAVLPWPQRYSVSSPSPHLLSRQAWVLERMSLLGDGLLDELDLSRA
jgi:monofunctional biosynthetic peptidoglycan transglycosylase